MIIVRSPLRITLGGGGTDLGSFSHNHGGFCISAAINKYIYISIHRTFTEKIILKYSKTENVKSPQDISHPIIKECIKLLDFQTPQLEIVSHADVPSNGSGLGSSGAFTVALLKALYLHKNIATLPHEIAELACNINIDKLGMIQGKQDEYISSLGGIMCLEFQKNGNVKHVPLNISHDTLEKLQENLMLFYTNIEHNTNNVLYFQDKATKNNDKAMLSNLMNLKEIGILSKKLLEKGKMQEFAEMLNVQWDNKKERTNTSPKIEQIRNDALNNGAIGMKLVGSGNGGFLLGYIENKRKLKQYMKKNSLQELVFSFDFEGSQRIV